MKNDETREGDLERKPNEWENYCTGKGIIRLGQENRQESLSVLKQLYRTIIFKDILSVDKWVLSIASPVCTLE